MSKPGTPVICLETEERFESMKEAMERYGVSPGSLNSALTYGYSAGGYHFYRADEPKPDDAFPAPSFAASTGNRKAIFFTRCSRCRSESSIRT